jgi:hypothetical protein
MHHSYLATIPRWVEGVMIAAARNDCGGMGSEA